MWVLLTVMILQADAPPVVATLRLPDAEECTAMGEFVIDRMRELKLHGRITCKEERES